MCCCCYKSLFYGRTANVCFDVVCGNSLTVRLALCALQMHANAWHKRRIVTSGATCLWVVGWDCYRIEGEKISIVYRENCYDCPNILVSSDELNRVRYSQPGELVFNSIFWMRRWVHRFWVLFFAILAANTWSFLFSLVLLKRVLFNLTSGQSTRFYLCAGNIFKVDKPEF